MRDQRGCLASGQIAEKKALQLGHARVAGTRISFSHEPSQRKQNISRIIAQILLARGKE
jgi:hypothetical protein